MSSYVRVGYWKAGYAVGDISVDVVLSSVPVAQASASTYARSLSSTESVSHSFSSYGRVLEAVPSVVVTHSYSLLNTPYVYSASGAEVNSGLHRSRVPSSVSYSYAIGHTDKTVLSVQAKPKTAGPYLRAIPTLPPAEVFVGLGLIASSYYASHTVGKEESYTYFPGQHTAGKELPYIYGVLDMQYMLDTDSFVLHEWSLDQEYNLVFPIPESCLDQQYDLLAISEVSRSLDQEWSLGISEFSLDMLHAVAGASIFTDFLPILNDFRESIGVVPPMALYLGDSPDIAQIHSRNMVSTGTYAHESAVFPVGWRSPEDRYDQLNEPISSAAENLAAFILPPGHSLTAEDIFDAWYNSPGHYANMAMPGSPNFSDLYILLGVDFYASSINGTPVNRFSGMVSCLITLNLVDLGPGRELMAVQSTLNMSYSLTTPVFETLGMQWDTRTYVKARNQNESPYRLIVSAVMDAPYSVFVARQHAAPIYYTIQNTHEALYQSTVTVAGDHDAGYAVEEYSFVHVQHSTLWASSLIAVHEAGYEPNAVVSVSHSADYENAPTTVASHEATYEEFLRLLVGHTAEYENASSVIASLSSLYDVKANVVASVDSPYGDQVKVLTQQDSPYDLSMYNFVKYDFTSFYSMYDDSGIVVTPDVSVEIAGIPVDYESIEVTADEGDEYWTMTVTLSEVADYVRVRLKDSIAISIDGVVFNGIIDTKPIDRTDATNIAMSVTAVSPVALLDTPYVLAQDYLQSIAIGAHDLVEQILGQPVDWQIADWTIKPYRFAAQAVTPLAAARIIVEAAGAVLESNPDGSLYVRYLFPVSVPEFSTAAADEVFSDIEDNLSSREKNVYTPLFNKFRIREGSGTVSDYLEWTQDEGSSDSGILRAYPLPWRPASLEVRHTDGSIVSLQSIGVGVREEEELVEIREGQAELRYPAVSIVSLDWKSEDMGGLYLEPRTRTVTALNRDVNWGYGLVSVKYVVECLEYRVQFPVDNVVQFILLDKGV